jgi:hypothetical protein
LSASEHLPENNNKYTSGIILTNSMEQSPSSEANSQSASEEIPCLM